MAKLEVVLKRIGRRRKFRKIKEISKLNFMCMFCYENKAAEQLASRYGRCGDKIVAASWYWICDDCKWLAGGIG